MVREQRNCSIWQNCWNLEWLLRRMSMLGRIVKYNVDDAQYEDVKNINV